ncbi:unnamed protein product, partial [Symbiodinium sp. KB8]
MAAPKLPILVCLHSCPPHCPNAALSLARRIGWRQKSFKKAATTTRLTFGPLASPPLKWLTACRPMPI